MPKQILNGLTVRQVAAFDKPGLHADGRNLYLSISPHGHKSWVMRFTMGGRVREMGLGPVHDVTLAQARDAAAEARLLIRKLIDPIDERNKRKAELSQNVQLRRIHFIDALDAWLRHRNLKGKNALSIENPIRTYIVPVLGKLPVADITPTQVYKALTTKVKDKSLWDMVIGDRTLSNLAALFVFAIAKGWRENPINPADREQLKIVGLKPRKHEIKHLPDCPYSLIPEFWKRLQTYTDTSMMALRWAVLNASRPGEARKLRWAWIDTTNRIATIPASEMKSGREHRIPYSDAAATLLDTMYALRTGSEYVFPNHRGEAYSQDLMPKLAQRVMPEIKITAHGFRTSFKDWAGEMTTFESDMIETALAHHVGNKVAQAYQRGSFLAKRRTMMEAWATYCQTGRTDKRYRSEFVTAAD